MRTPPRATYRVQLRPGFGFAEATAIVPYLAELGVSHLYCSPYMEAALGSAHGYDVVDPGRVRAELGGDEGLAALDRCLAAHGMGQLLDIVPNHMCVTDPRNRYWWDVLLRGRDSAYAGFFDIDWEAPGLDQRVLLPVLADDLEAVLRRGELRLVMAPEPELRYHDHRLPLCGATGAREGAVPRELLDRQHYRLERWSSGLRHVNYRRFFDVSSLAGLRQESMDVFDATHRRALELVRSEVVDGLRVDHVDGLRAPRAYVDRLREAAPNAWLVVEKILAGGEALPASWPVDGTTGYEFGALLTALMVDRAGLDALDAVYREFTGDTTSFAGHARQSKLAVLRQLLESELGRLTRAAAAADVDGASVEIAALIAALAVYRVYPEGWAPLDGAEQQRLDEAAAVAREVDGCDPVRLACLLDVLAARGSDSAARRGLRERFQQVSSAAAAKGVEDTAFYRSVRLVALNEVGCDPDRTASVDDFHRACAATLASRPHTLLATATHDTKRGEDARLRLAMLSEMPSQWAAETRRWRALTSRHRGSRAPSATAEYLLYQTLVAAHPIDVDRAWAYMLKAAREAKQETSWLDPDAGYEAELERFVRGAVSDPAVRAAVAGFVDQMTPAWQTASLSQTLLRLTAPGVADTYQGSELWQLCLVDPDNRTPVDYRLRARLLRDLTGLQPCDIMARSAEGLPKLHLIRETLQLRARRAPCFGRASTYAAMPARGTRARHVIGFTRGTREAAPVVAVIGVRLARTVGDAWADTTVVLPGGAWRNILTGGAVEGGERRVAQLLAEFPVAALERAA